MSDDENKNKSAILVEFKEYGSAIFTIKAQNVSPLQLFAIASYLEFEARWQINQQKLNATQEYEDKKIVVPKAEVLVGKK